jgi:hypothetical protein
MQVVHEELSVSQTARETGYSGQMIRVLCNSGKLAHRLTALGRLIPRSAVDELKRQREQRQAPV